MGQKILKMDSFATSVDSFVSFWWHKNTIDELVTIMSKS